MFYCFFSSLAWLRYSSLFSCVLPRWQSSLFCWFSFLFFSFFFFFFLTIIRSGRLAEIRWSVCISKSQINVCLILLEGFRVIHIPLVRMVKFKFLAQFPVDHLRTHSYQVLYGRDNHIGMIIIIIIILPLWEFFTRAFTRALADGFSLESKWQQVSSSLQDSS